MIPRATLDIPLTMLVAALFGGRRSAAATPSALLDGPNSLLCLSVRSGLDALLTALAWEPGTEVLLSAVTIPAIAHILEGHGLVPVPVDVDAQTLAPDLGLMTERATSRTRAVLVASLFGSRPDLTPYHKLADRFGLHLWEDLAQGYCADGYHGDPRADVRFLSFGLIKAQTAVSGGLVLFRDAELAGRCWAVHDSWPPQSPARFRRKAAKAIALRLLGNRTAYSVLHAASRWANFPLEARLIRATRGFDAAHFFDQLRRRPCPTLEGLVRTRLARPDVRWLSVKTELGRSYDRHLPAEVRVGTRVPFPAYWVYPVLSREPAALCRALVARGYDATVSASQIRVVPPPACHPDWNTSSAAEWLPRLVFLPLHPALRARHIIEIAEIVAAHERTEPGQPG